MARAISAATARAGEAAVVDAPSRWPRVVAALGIVVLTVFAYEPALRAGWVWDDIDIYVTNNALVKSPGGLWDIWFGFYRDPAKGGALVVKTHQYYPLVFSSFWLDHKLFGLAPAGFHALNVLLHLLNVALVFRLARRLAIPGAAFVAGLFALHPMMVESVAWVSERKNVLSGAFYLGAFLAYLRFDDAKQARWYLASLVLFLGALLSKTVTATLPCALLLAVVWRRGRLGTRDVAYVLPFVAVAVVLGWFSVHLEHYAVGARGVMFAQTAFERLTLIVPRTFLFYPLKVLWPYPITFIYPRFDPHASDPSAFAWLVACLAIGAALLVARRRTGNGPLLLVVFSAVTLAPALGFVPVYPHRYSWVADHFAYLGNLGFFALVASAGVWLVQRFAPATTRPAVLAGVAAALLVLCAARSHHAAQSYRDEETLWTDTLAESPDAWIAIVNLGIAYMVTPPQTEERMAASMELFKRAERFEIARGFAFANQGLWHKRRGSYEEAADAFRRALAVEPSEKHRRFLAELRAAQSRAAMAEQRTDEARRACRAGVAEVGYHPRLMPSCAPLVSGGS